MFFILFNIKVAALLISNNKVVDGFIHSFIGKEYGQSNFIHTNLDVLIFLNNLNYLCGIFMFNYLF
jgi:hypothetical protein